uniref:uncharacterized protein LOC114582269 isoform X2 n=1 Tax=Podarcis muralis TaxID=64176 RepID=UPI00109F73AD|nr:uncharacterized protein LOC114582269 isoform X2 [Podarcis muralis]
MYQALKFIPMDVHGNLDFADFLDILKTTPSFTEREALKNALFIFKNIRKDMVAIDDLETILACLGVTLSPKVIQHAVGSIRVTWDGKINISEFLSLVRGPPVCHKGLDESSTWGSSRGFSSNTDDSETQWRMLPAHQPLFYNPDYDDALAQLRKRKTKSQKPAEAEQTKPSTAIPESRVEEKTIEWPKVRRSFGYTSQDTLFPLSSTLSLKEDARISAQKARKMSLSASQEEDVSFSVINYDAIQKQKKKKRLSFSKDLPRRYDFEETFQTSDSESEGKPSEAVSDQQALQNAFDILSTLAEDYMKGNELHSTFHKMGVSVNEKEFQDVLQKAGLARDGMVNFSNFVSALGKTSRITEFAMLKGAIQAINKIEGGKVAVNDLPAFARCMGVHLSDHDFKRALKHVSVDGDGKVVVKDFMKVFTNTPHFSDLTVLKGIIKAVDTLQESRISLDELNPTLKSMGIRLNPHEYEQLITRTSSDKTGKIDIGQVLKKISKLRRFTEMEVLNNAIKTFSQFKDEKVKVSDVEACFRTIGVHLTRPELKQAINSVVVSADGTVVVKELTAAMKSTRRFANFSGVMENICALKLIKEHSMGESPAVEGTTSRLGLRMANRLIAQVLKSARMTEAGQPHFINFLRLLTRSDQIRTAAALTDGFESLAKVENGKIGMEGLQVVLNSFNIILSPKEASDALALCNVDGKKTVNLKDFFKGTTYTATFITHPELQLTCMALNKLKGAHFNLHALESTLKTLDLLEANELLQEVMKTAKTDMLTDAMNAMSNIRGDQVQVDDLPKTLANVGIKLTPEELQQLIHSVPVTGDGTVGFDEIIRSITGTQSISEFDALKKAFDAISGLCKQKIKKEELPVALEILGIRLSAEELQLALTSVSIDGSGRLDGIEFLKVWFNSPHFFEFIALRDAMKHVESIRNKKMTVQQLEGSLGGLGLYLPNKTFNDIVKSVKTDENEQIYFKDFLLGLGETEDFTELEALQRAATIIDIGNNGWMQPKELQSTLDTLGIYLKHEEFQEIAKELMNDEGIVNVKDCLITLSKRQRFKDSLALQSAVVNFSKIRGEKVDVRDLESIMEGLGINLSNTEFQNALKTIPVDEFGRVTFKDFLTSVVNNERFSESVAVHNLYMLISKMDGDKVEVSQLKDILAPMGILLTKDDAKEVLKSMSVKRDGMVKLKEFMNELPNTRRFSTAVEMEGAMKTMNSIKQGWVDTGELDSIMRSMGLNLLPDEIEQALKNVTPNDHGKVSVERVLSALTKTRRFSQAESNKVPIENLDSILESMGIVLTNEGMQEVLKQVKVDEDGKVNLNEFMNSLSEMQQTLEGDQGDMVAMEEVDSVLSNLGIHLTKEQLQEALKYVTVNENGKVNMSELMASVVKNQAEADRVPVDNLNAILATMSIQLTDDELQEALKSTTVDDDGKVNLNEFMEGVKNVQLKAGIVAESDTLSPTLEQKSSLLSEEQGKKDLTGSSTGADDSLSSKEAVKDIHLTQPSPTHEGEMVDVQDLGDVLAIEGIQLAEEEFQEALKNAPVDAEGKVNLEEFMKQVRKSQQHRQSEEEISVLDLGSILARKGFFLSDKELQEVLANVDVNEDGTVNLSDCLKEIQALRGLSSTKKRVAIENLEEVLDEMGTQLTNKQLYEALKCTPIDADGTVDVETFKRGVHLVLSSQQTGKMVDVSKLDSILGAMGLRLTQMEVQEAIKRTINKDGTVNMKDFMWAIQDLPSIQDEKVDISDLDTVLGGMGIFLTQEELEEAQKIAMMNEDGTVNLKEFVRACNVTLARSEMEGTYVGKKLHAKSIRFPKVTERHHQEAPSRIPFSEAPSDMGKSRAARNLTKPQLEAFRNAYDSFSKDFDGTIDLGALQSTAYNLGINLTEEEAFDELVYADTDRDGKVNFTDFLNIITDSNRFIQAVAPRKGDMETVDARGILLFELLSKLVETSMLPRKTTVNIVSYYRQKFLESTGKKAWRSDSIAEGKSAQKKGPMKKSKSTSLSAFAGAARICVMKDKELEEYVEQLREKIAPSESPYSQVPIFPLIPNQDGLTSGRPKKNLQKLEQLRRQEPLSSFEDHFFHKKRWLKQEPKSNKPKKLSLSLAPQLTHGKRRFTFDNLEEIRREVKKATDAYRMAIALRERNKSLKLWKRVRGAEIGLDSGSTSFYQTFSTYSWSWNVCQELLTPRELREYDRKTYQDSCRSSAAGEKLIRAGGRHKGSKK